MVLLLVLFFSSCSSDMKVEEKIRNDIKNQMEENQRRLEEKQRQVEETERLNEELKEKKSHLEELFSQEENEEYIRRSAEEQGYVDPNAIIFEDISGN